MSKRIPRWDRDQIWKIVFESVIKATANYRSCLAKTRLPGSDFLFNTCMLLIQRMFYTSFSPVNSRKKLRNRFLLKDIRHIVSHS